MNYFHIIKAQGTVFILSNRNDKLLVYILFNFLFTWFYGISFLLFLSAFGSN